MFAKLAGHADYNGMPVWCTNLSLLAISAVQLGYTALRCHSCRFALLLAKRAAWGGGQQVSIQETSGGWLMQRDETYINVACHVDSRDKLHAVDPHHVQHIQGGLQLLGGGTRSAP